MTQEPLNTHGAELALSVERILTRLTSCLDRETKAVIANDLDTFNSLREEKLRLLEQYRGLSEQLSRDPSALDKIDGTIRNHLRAVSMSFQESITKNQSALQAGHGAVSRLMERIMNTARRTVTKDTQKYNKHGALYASGNARGAMIPTKLNETL